MKRSKLRFRQRIRAFLLDRVLRGENKERLGQFMRLPPHRNFMLLHGFQKRGLRFGRRSVDFIRQNHIGKEGPAQKHEFALPRHLVFLYDFRARDVGRHQVGRKLDTLVR